MLIRQACFFPACCLSICLSVDQSVVMGHIRIIHTLCTHALQTWSSRTCIHVHLSSKKGIHFEHVPDSVKHSCRAGRGEVEYTNTACTPRPWRLEMSKSNKDRCALPFSLLVLACTREHFRCSVTRHVKQGLFAGSSNEEAEEWFLVDQATAMVVYG